MTFSLSEDRKQAFQTFTVASYDCSVQKQMKLSAVLRYFQELAELHCRAFDCGHEKLLARDAAFFLIRTQMHIARLPRFEEKVTAVTWQRTIQGVYFIRDCLLLDEAGNRLVESTGTWVAMHPSNRRPWRPKDLNCVVPSYPEEALSFSGTERFSCPDTLPTVGQRPIYYSDLDYNGHLNNCVYADFLTDFMPNGMDHKQITTLQLHFCKEAQSGDILAMRVEQFGNQVFFRGAFPEEDTCFEAIVKIKE